MGADSTGTVFPGKESAVMGTKTINKLVWLVLALGLLASGGLLAADRIPIADNDITLWVQQALREDPRVPAHDLRIATESGIVKLRGTVWSLAEKNIADLESKKIRGVRGVINEIEVRPLERPDAMLRDDIDQRLRNDPSLSGHDIHVAVEAGVVTLTGNVSSYTERDEAGIVASEVLGLKNLHNDILAVWKTSRGNTEIAKDITSSLERDVYLTDMPLRVTVNDGLVTLRGKVGTAYQKQRAGDAAWTANVRDVQNEIEVDPWLDKGTRKQAPWPGDEDIQSSVTDEIFEDLRLIEPFDIKVEASQGNVTLTGTVPTYAQLRVAEQDARDVVGVAWVSNLLMVNSPRREDKAIQGAVQHNIDTDFDLSGQGVMAQVRQGVVTLKGSVSTFYDKVHATDVAARVSGVQKVANDLNVNWWSHTTDRSLQKRIEKRLLADWETTWMAPAIHVDVQGGKVKLSGIVDTWVERAEAGRVAFNTDGVWMVNNELGVAGADYSWNRDEYRGPYASGFDPYGYYHFYYLDIPF
jgi:osmotically-inducible protein OsmY